MTRRSAGAHIQHKSEDDESNELGVRCPTCACRDVPVYKTIPFAQSRRRYRRCRYCGRRFVTTEKVAE